MTGSGGSIVAESEPGRGALFRLRFPLAEGKVEPLAGASPPAALRSRGGTILLVEDEAGVLQVTSRQLQAQGYRVLAAGGADEALALFRLHQGEICLIITDVNMPGTSGPALVQDLRDMGSKKRVLFISGYGLDILSVEDRPKGSEFLSKPFSSETLAAKIDEMLVGAPA